jgi:hypothetical protein
VTPLTTRGRQVRTRLYDPGMVAQLAVVVLAVGVLLFVQSFLTVPDKVAVTVVNPTDYDIDVTVRTPDTTTRTIFGRVERGGTRLQPRLIDPGREWVLTFSHDGTELAELRLSADELDDLGHRIEVPPEVTSKARDADLLPTPT